MSEPRPVSDPGPFPELGPRRARRAAGAALTTSAPAGEPPDLSGGGDPARRRPARPSSHGWARWVRLPAVGALLLLWAASCLVRAASAGPLATLVVAVTTATPFIAVVAVPVVTLAARNRRWVTVGAAAVAAVLPWTLVLGYASASDRPPATDTAPLKVMLVNAHAGGAAPSDIVSAVAADGVDLLVVTELSGALAHDLTAAGLDRLVSPRWVDVPQQVTAGYPVDAGIGIWSKAEVDDVQAVVGTAWPAVTAKVVSPEATFTLVTGHVVTPLTYGGQQWARDLSALRAASAAARAKGPVVVLANINATPWHADFRTFSGSGLVDAADALGQGLRPTWPTWSPLALLPLDHALVGGGVAVDAVDTVVVAGTDHRALVVTLGVPRSVPSGKGG